MFFRINLQSLPQGQIVEEDILLHHVSHFPSDLFVDWKIIHRHLTGKVKNSSSQNV